MFDQILYRTAFKWAVFVSLSSWFNPQVKAVFLSLSSWFNPHKACHPFTDAKEVAVFIFLCVGNGSGCIGGRCAYVLSKETDIYIYIYLDFLGNSVCLANQRNIKTYPVFLVTDFI